CPIRRVAEQTNPCSRDQRVHTAEKSVAGHESRRSAADKTVGAALRIYRMHEEILLPRISPHMYSRYDEASVLIESRNTIAIIRITSACICVLTPGWACVPWAEECFQDVRDTVKVAVLRQDKC